MTKTSKSIVKVPAKVQSIVKSPMTIEAAARIRSAEVKLNGTGPKKGDFNVRADQVAQKRKAKGSVST